MRRIEEGAAGVCAMVRDGSEGMARHIVQMSNISTNEVAAAGKYGGLGPYGTTTRRGMYGSGC